MYWNCQSWVLWNLCFLIFFWRSLKYVFTLNFRATVQTWRVTSHSAVFLFVLLRITLLIKMTQQSWSIIPQTNTNHLIPWTFVLHLNVVTVRRLIAMCNNPLNPLPAEIKQPTILVEGLDLRMVSAVLQHKASSHFSPTCVHICVCFCVCAFPSFSFISCLLIYGMALVSGIMVFGVFMVLYIWQLNRLHCCLTHGRLNCKLPHVVKYLSSSVSAWLEETQRHISPAAAVLCERPFPPLHPWVWLS